MDHCFLVDNGCIDQHLVLIVVWEYAYCNVERIFGWIVLIRVIQGAYNRSHNIHNARSKHMLIECVSSPLPYLLLDLANEPCHMTNNEWLGILMTMDTL